MIEPDRAIGEYKLSMSENLNQCRPNPMLNICTSPNLGTMNEIQHRSLFPNTSMIATDNNYRSTFNPAHNIPTFQLPMTVPHFEMPSTDTMVRNSLSQI